MRAVRRAAWPFFAVCVALAAGIALGAGPFQHPADADRSVSSREVSALHERIAALRDGQSFGEALTAAGSSSLVRHRLSGASVAIVVLPGVSSGTVKEVTTALSQSGASVSATVTISASLVDSAKKTYVASVASNALRRVHDLADLDKQSGYAQIAGLIARAYVGRSAGPIDDEASKIDAELEGAKLVRRSSALHTRAELAIVLGAGEDGSSDVVTATHVIETQVISGLANVADGVLVNAPPTASALGGLIDAIHEDRDLRHARLSTLNVLDGWAAHIAAVDALAATASGASGHYGVDGSQVILPPQPN